MHIRFGPRTFLLTLFITLIATGAGSTGSAAQDLPFLMDVPLEGVDGYDPSIPKPETIIGHVIGTRHTTPAEVVAYFHAVAEASDRVVLAQHAETYEGNPLIHAIVTSPENHSNLEQIRAANRTLSDAPGMVEDDDISEMPVVLYQGYSIHGDEASGTEAAVLYLYHLAAGRGPAVEDALDHAVVLLDPLFNPDGRDRFVDWVNRNRGNIPVSDTQDREHNQEWPGGRTNHYWFDLNRDWLPAQHPESRGRMRVFHEWRPQILTDHHEMGTGSTFFFQPGIPSRNNPNTPERTYELTGALAEYHARVLDSVGAGYYTRESFDDFYYGKGSTYPDINGAIGILFEQASSRALIADSDAGTLHYAFTVRNQFLTSLSTLEGAVALREEFLTHQRDFYADATRMADESGIGAWLIGKKRGLNRAQFLAQLLRRHRVEVYELADDVSVGGTSYAAGEAYVVPAAQPQYRLLNAAFERTLSYGDSLFYDVSTWTLPLAFDVDFHELGGDIDDLRGVSLDQVMLDGGAVHGGPGDYAWILSWDAFFAPTALHELLDAGYAARMMQQDFTAVVDGQEVSFPRGSVVVPAVGRLMPGEEADVPALESLVRDLVERYHVQVWAVDSGLTPDGPDLGATSAATLTAARIGLLTGPGTSSYQAGEAWHALSERFSLPVSLLDADRVSGMDLSRYTTIVVPGGFFGDSETEALKSFARSGGHLLMLSGAVDYAVSNGFAQLEELSVDVDSLAEGRPYDEIGDVRGAQAVGGSIFSVDLDTTHPLTYGLPESLPVFHTGNEVYESTDESDFVFGRYAEDPLLSGYLSEEFADLLPSTVAATSGRFGRGRVTVFMDRLNFRAFWYGTQRLFMNAAVVGHNF